MPWSPRCRTPYWRGGHHLGGLSVVEPVPGYPTKHTAVAWSPRSLPPVGIDPKTPSPVYLARHGQTESNVLRRYAGYRAEPLTEVGRGQMIDLAARLGLRGIAEIWTSEVAR